MVSSSGAVHLVDQPGTDSSGGPRPGSLDLSRTILGRSWRGDCHRCGSWVWSIALSRDPLFQSGLGSSTLPLRFGSAAVFWCLSLIAIIAWRKGSVGSWAPLTILAVELSGLFYLGPIPWGLDGWPSPGQSNA